MEDETPRMPAPLKLVLKILVLAALAWLGWGLFGPHPAEREMWAALSRERVCLWRLNIHESTGVAGPLPETLEDTLRIRGVSEPVDGMEHARDRGKRAVDGWRRSIRYTPEPGGLGFEIRSAGADGEMDTADDFVETGRLGEDRTAAEAEYRAAREAREEVQSRIPRRRRRF